jgi:hypothetical protein
MLRFLDGTGAIFVEGPISADAHVAPGAVNTGDEPPSARPSKSTQTTQHRPSMMGQLPSKQIAPQAARALILSAFNSIGGSEISCGRIAGTAKNFPRISADPQSSLNKADV